LFQARYIEDSGQELNTSKKFESAAVMVGFIGLLLNLSIMLPGSF